MQMKSSRRNYREKSWLRSHQVRRMFAATGNHVTALHREGLGGLILPDDLLPGQWTLLDAAQIAAIFDECACH